LRQLPSKPENEKEPATPSEEAFEAPESTPAELSDGATESSAVLDEVADESNLAPFKNEPKIAIAQSRAKGKATGTKNSNVEPESAEPKSEQEPLDPNSEQEPVEQESQSMGNSQVSTPSLEVKKPRVKKTSPKKQAPDESIDGSESDEETSDLDSSPVSPPKPKPSFFKRIKEWIASIFARKASVVETLESVEEVETEEPVEELSTPEIKSRLRKVRAEIKASQHIVSASEAEVASLEKSILSNDKNSRLALEWMSSVEGSYQWRVQEKMDQQLAEANADLKSFKDAVEEVSEFPAGRLIELRKKFHKSIASPNIVLVPIALLVIIIPWIFTIPRISWLDGLYNPGLLAPIVSIAVGIIIGIIVVARRTLGKERVTNGKIIKWITFTLLLVFAISNLPVIEEFFRSFAIPFLERFTPEILWTIASINVFWALIALLAYHAEWSKYKKDVEDQIRRLQGVVAGYTHSTQEVHRLTSLHNQASSWLEIMAHALYRPWRVNPDWEKTGELAARAESFPFALRIAEVRDEAGPESAELERVISAKLMVQGWRAEAFTDLVNQVRNDLGLPEGAFSVAVLDKDLPHQSNNTRALLRKYLERSGQAASQESQDVPPHDKYLVEVARKRLMDLVNETQSVALSTARPRVTQIQSDPLAEIDLDSDSLSDLKDSETWDDFLKESLGTEEIVQPPISILNFSDKGRLSRGAESPATFIITPKRLVGALPASRSDSITIIPVGDNKARSVELIARVDIAGPLEAEMLKVLSGGESQMKTATLNLCPECRDPLCDASLDSNNKCSSETL
jgi:hypothetical protein